MIRLCVNFELIVSVSHSLLSVAKFRSTAHHHLKALEVLKVFE
jgi:hypothetical protein